MYCLYTVAYVAVLRMGSPKGGQTAMQPTSKISRNPYTQPVHAYVWGAAQWLKATSPVLLL